MKTCRICKEAKELEEFHAAPGTRDGHRGECKGCFRALASARYRRDPDSMKRRVKAWQEENPDRVQASRDRTGADGRRSASNRKSYLKRTYGLTVEQYDEMLAAQGGVCAICGREPRDDISLHIDHDHETGQIRGLLCFRCNNAMGDLGDDLATLGRAMAYLRAADPDAEARSADLARAMIEMSLAS